MSQSNNLIRIFRLPPLFICRMPYRTKRYRQTSAHYLTIWLFVVGGFLGAMLVLWQTKTTESFHSGYIIAVVGSFFAGFSLNLVRKLRTNNDFSAPYFYFCLVGAPVSASALFFLGPETMPDQTRWIALAIVSGLALSAQLLMNYGLKALSAHSSGVILTSQVIMAGFIGIFIFDDPITRRLFAGMVLIICCGVMLTVPRKRRKDQA